MEDTVNDTTWASSSSLQPSNFPRLPLPRLSPLPPCLTPENQKPRKGKRGNGTTLNIARQQNPKHNTTLHYPTQAYPTSPSLTPPKNPLHNNHSSHQTPAKPTSNRKLEAGHITHLTTPNTQVPPHGRAAQARPCHAMPSTRNRNRNRNRNRKQSS
ncbi:uncharacterized protein EI97DRAFT_306266 [Westerdykella ornata]|uniref:Uncharacterized protein n=1 Tax=Westerdykella ornata TaxID=318751 RepID=A0A6A6JLN2_WESOR|nr:uncharacterized protein EI97DRAFT_306266 [Westerdykella ornata]KAF2277023.1 hypothetical protein EI97DRAFT_306266 [Westerdykella ornata]